MRHKQINNAAERPLGCAYLRTFSVMISNSELAVLRCCTLCCVCVLQLWYVASCKKKQQVSSLRMDVKYLHMLQVKSAWL